MDIGKYDVEHEQLDKYREVTNMYREIGEAVGEIIDTVLGL